MRYFIDGKEITEKEAIRIRQENTAIFNRVLDGESDELLEGIKIIVEIE